MTGSKTKVAQIGTCRLNNPLRRGAARLGFTLQNDRNYGYTHNSSEALQQLRFKLGEVQIPDDVARLICRRGTDTKLTGSYDLPDLNFIEISSAKLITCQGWAVQLNYLNRHFADFLSNRDRAAWFWQLATEATADQLLARLQAEPAYKRLDATDQTLLAALRLAESDPARLGRDIDAIVERLGADKIVLVTHIDARLADGSAIASRSQLIADVRDSAQQRGLRCYDPTSAMEGIGQDRAVEKHGLDTNHYTDAFSDLLCDEFHALFMPRTNFANVSTIDGLLDEQAVLAALQRQWEIGDFRAASREVRRRINAGDKAPGLELLFGRISFDLGDDTAAWKSLSVASGQKGPDDGLQQMRMLTASNLGKAQIALKIGEALLGDETENEQIIETCAKSALALGLFDTSTFYWRRLFWMRNGDETAATAALEILTEHNIPEAIVWRETVLDIIPTHRAALLHLWNDLINQSDRNGLLARISAFAALDTDTIVRLVAEASDIMPLVAARLLTAHLAIGNGTSEAATPLRDIALQLSERYRMMASKLVQDGIALKAVEPLQAANIIHLKPRVMLTIHKLMARTLRIETRAALAAKDHDRVVTICNECIATKFDFPEIHSFLGRAFIKLNRTADAMVHLRIAAEHGTDPAAAWFNVERLAVKAGMFADAIEAGIKAEAAGGAYGAQALKLLDSIVSRSLRDVRRMTSEGSYEDAWRLSDAIIKIRPDDASSLRERRVILAALRAQIGQSEGATRLEFARRLLALDPVEPTGLRTLAVETMRNHDFAESLELWQRLNDTGSNDKRIARNMVKCRLFIDRIARRATVPVKVAVAKRPAPQVRA